ncbi:DUF2079 domain-containing protein [Hymenobacter gummosus]|uniref:DUF2079 domain-containing protein n=1 Tax=Hymenobacter gummosus TaxID=1776032 RepID=A0A3S0H4K1_9BACT|nr:DUF2079 domain-containing protein [Hymenobacter gummosus]RTQ47598.1 DUF2079 domain-containing protein [Hymenobacter gummosus]
MPSLLPAPARRYRRALLGVLGFFGLCFVLLSLVNHYQFRTYAYDLGIYNQALWDYAHLRWNVNSIMRYNNLLGDHFTPLQLLWAPLYWPLRSYALLVVQVVAALAGGYGVYRLHGLRSGGRQPGAAVALAAHFLSIWGVYSALAFDYHDNVVAALLLPWLFYLFERDRRGATVLLFGLLLLSKENVALWLVFVALGLAALHWRRRDRLVLALGLVVMAAGYFVLVTQLIIPALSEGRDYLYGSRYAAVGEGFGGILRTAVSRPLYLLGLLFRNHLPHTPDGDYIKLELHLMVLVSGGYALLRRPAYLLMLVPIYAQKLFSAEIMHWGLNYQYSIEFVPVLSAAVGHWLLAAAPRQATRLAAAAALLALVATITSMEIRVSKWHDKSASQFYLPRHYRRGFDVAAVHRGLALIPAGAAVSSLSPLTPHLAFRPYTYMFPYVGDAEYIAVLRGDNPYPLTEVQLERRLTAYRRSPAWRVLHDEAPLLILQHVSPQPLPARRYFAERAAASSDTLRLELPR